ncbi:unnamed protein product [Amoebophrya sp. A120]|nr:unnamed protein product [Amoebophrya sp. A120]|eukprot:GSA120T00019005001.1
MSFDMDIHRLDFLQLGPMNRNTLCVLPLAKKKQQKVCVGDDSGVLTVFYLKRGETQIEWKSQNLGREITKVVLQSGRDKIFAACGQSIQGFTRKGKEFLKIKTNLTETIHHLFADDTTIWTGGEYIMNLYDNCRDAGFVMCPDRINDLLCAPVSTECSLSSILAFQDKFIRVYAGERMLHEFASGAAATALGFYDRSEIESRPAGSQKQVHCMFGTDAGDVGVVAVDEGQMRETFRLKKGRSASAVTHVCCGDIGRSGVLDLCVAREDGTLEIWNLSGQDANQLDPSACRLMFETQLGECVRSLDVGTVALGEYKDLVVSTYSGKVLGFTADPAAQDATGAQMVDLCPEGGANPAAATAKREALNTGGSPTLDASVASTKDKRFKQLKQEVQKLKTDVDAQRRKYEQEVSREGIAVTGSHAKVSHSFKLKPEDACYQLVIECQSNLASVSVRSDAAVDLLDVPSQTVDVIQSKAKQSQQDPLLLTYRFQEQTKRFAINMRTTEGPTGNISCFVLPQAQPKIAHLINLNVKPLSLHEKVADIEEKCAMNELRLSGNFTLMDMHHWMSLCLPDVPARPANHDSCLYNYKSTFLGTLLQCQYSKGQAKFRSDSITTISVVRDTMSREATARKIQLSIQVDVKEESFPYVLSLIHPKLAFQQALTRQVQFVEPLKEIQLQETAGEKLDFLDPELQEILAHSDRIQKQFELQPQRLSTTTFYHDPPRDISMIFRLWSTYLLTLSPVPFFGQKEKLRTNFLHKKKKLCNTGFLHGLIVSLYTHIWRMRGHQGVPSHKLRELQHLLINYQLETLQQFFEEPVQ